VLVLLALVGRPMRRLLQPAAPAGAKTRRDRRTGCSRAPCRHPKEAAPAATEVPAPAATKEAAAPSGDKPYAGPPQLVLASMTDQYVAAFRVLLPSLKNRPASKSPWDEVGLRGPVSKTDGLILLGHTANYDLMTG